MRGFTSERLKIDAAWELAPFELSNEQYPCSTVVGFSFVKL